MVSPAFGGATVMRAPSGFFGVVTALVLAVGVRPGRWRLCPPPIVLAVRLRFTFPLGKTSMEPLMLYFPGFKTFPCTLTVIKKLKLKQSTRRIQIKAMA